MKKRDLVISIPSSVMTMNSQDGIVDISNDGEYDSNGKRMKTEDGEAPWIKEKKMSLHSLLNEDGSSTVPGDPKGSSTAGSAVPDGEEQHEGMATRSTIESERYMAREAPDMDSASSYPSSAPLVQRAICSICRSESGRCHASDPVSMQAFFSTSLGYEGVLSYADWLCMKCYSKWYNRCKRKATNSVPNINTSGLGSHGDTSPTSPPRRKRANGKASANVSPMVDLKESNNNHQKEVERDPENDDALLLTRMVGNGNSSNQGTPISIQRDLESEVDELRGELHRVRGEVIRLSQELSRRDEQMEDMLKFVKTEISAMHILLKEIAEAKWKTTAVHSLVNNPSPAVHVQAGAPAVVYTNPLVPPHASQSRS